MALASWLPIRIGLTPHGLRHGHKTWLDDLKIHNVLQAERMGHEVPGIQDVYSHITPRMRAELTAGLQELWEESLRQRASIASRSAVSMLDKLMAPQRERRREVGEAKADTLAARRVARRLREPERGDWEAGR